jgi:hypothetical protein
MTNAYYQTLPDGGVYSVDIAVSEVDGGVQFTSPIDGYSSVVQGITIATLRGRWCDSDEHASDILDAVANMGACRWVVGERTEYDLVTEDGKDYFIVTERVDLGKVAS